MVGTVFGKAPMRSTVLLDPDPAGAGYTVTVPALPGIVTEGRTSDEALANAREAIACHLEGLVEAGDRVPREEPPLIPIAVEIHDAVSDGVVGAGMAGAGADAG